MARSFASGDKVHLSGGNAAAITGAVWMAIICKLDSSRDASWRNLLSVLTVGEAAGAVGYQFEMNPSNQTIFGANGVSNGHSTTTTTSADGWCLHVMTKVAGSAIPRYHRYKYSTGVWVHEAMSIAESNCSAGGVVEIGGGYGASGDNFVGDVDAAGMGNVALADQDIEAFAYTWQAWSQAAQGLWLLDQSATSQKVVDTSGGGANELNITGTSVSTSSVPVFNYGDGVWVPTIVKPASGGTTYNDSGSGTITLSGSGSESHTNSGSGSGTITLSGSFVQSYSHTSSGTGTLTLSGSFTQSQTHTSSRTGTIVLSGQGSVVLGTGLVSILLSLPKLRIHIR